jgi:hypothetical protein
MRFARASSAILLLILLVSAAAVQAQTTTGSIFGDVTDASGAVLSGATVRVSAMSTGADFQHSRRTRSVRICSPGCRRPTTW